MEPHPLKVIHQPDGVLNSMNEWCKKHHGASGLTKAVRESKVLLSLSILYIHMYICARTYTYTTLIYFQISMQECERQLLSFVSEHTPGGACPLAGNSVGQDAKFLSRLMPRLMEHLESQTTCLQVYRVLTWPLTGQSKSKLIFNTIL